MHYQRSYLKIKFTNIQRSSNIDKITNYKNTEINENWHRYQYSLEKSQDVYNYKMWIDHNWNHNIDIRLVKHLSQCEYFILISPILMISLYKDHIIVLSSAAL